MANELPWLKLVKEETTIFNLFRLPAVLWMSEPDIARHWRWQSRWQCWCGTSMACGCYGSMIASQLNFILGVSVHSSHFITSIWMHLGAVVASHATPTRLTCSISYFTGTVFVWDPIRQRNMSTSVMAIRLPSGGP